jgi:hypothetical protein
VTDQELLLDCLRRLNRVGIAYMLTGSGASNYWGIPRTTHDFDFVVQLPPSSIRDFVPAFSGDYYLDEAAIRSAFQSPFQFNAIDTRSDLKIDFWMLRPVPFEQEMFRRRIKVDLFKVPAWIATAEDVILHKLFWNQITPSDRQLGDVAGVFAVQKDTLDVDYLKRWATEIKCQDVLANLLAGDIRPKLT